MAMIRTRRLAWGRLGPAAGRVDGEASPRLISGDVYVVPMGYRAILRDHRFTTSDVGPDMFSVYTYARIGGVLHYIDGVNETRVGGSKVATLLCDLVLEEGDVYGLECNLGDLSYYITGALLVLPS